MDSTNDTTTEATPSAETLRAQMIAKVQQRGYGLGSEVERVLLDTPRHEFVPGPPWRLPTTRGRR